MKPYRGPPMTLKRLDACETQRSVARSYNVSQSTIFETGANSGSTECPMCSRHEAVRCTFLLGLLLTGPLWAADQPPIGGPT